MRAASTESRPTEPVDFGTVESAQKQLHRASEELSSMVDEIASARTVKEHHSDRSKRALALQVREFLADNSAAASETKGRASIGYGEALDALAGQYEAAEATIARWDAAKIRWETARSTLSSLRTIAGQI